ncbi:MAG: MobA/MobL family protein [Azospirillum sp.]|nr:MobA/MobL family protein [Azospirillum sp.]
MSLDDLINDGWPRAGRLDESEELRAIRALMNGPRGPMVRFNWSAARPQPARIVVPTTECGYRALSIGAAPAASNASTFHLRISSTSKKPAPQIPREVRRGHRVGIWPNRQEVRHLKSIPEAKRHRSARMWSLPTGHAFLRTPIGQTLSSDFAKAVAHLGREIDADKRALLRVLKHQRYIERSGGYSKRAEEIERDEHGPIIAGNIGLSPDATKAFWQAAVEEETRRDARLQDRLIVELPHWIRASDRRAIIERFGRVFGERNLPWFAAAHLPDRHGDDRNYHMHLVAGTRPFLSTPDNTRNEAEWTFAPTKDRKTQGSEWVTFLRRQFADIVNDVCAAAARRDGTEVKRIFFPGRAAEIGLTHTPSVHLGPARSALLRRGQGTAPRPVPPLLFDTIESAIRCHTRDRESIARATEKFDLLEERDTGVRMIRGVCFGRIDAARRAVEACGRFLDQLLEESSTTSVRDNDAALVREFEAGDFLRRFTRAGESVAAALVALAEFEAEIRRDEMARRQGDATPPALADAENKHRRLDEVDPEWVFREIAERLKRPWVPRKKIDGELVRVVHVKEGVAKITIGDDIELRLRHSKNLGWQVEYPRERDEEWLRYAPYDARFWNKVVRSLISITTLSLGVETVKAIISRHGLAAQARQRGQSIEIESPKGLLRIAADGRRADVYGDDPSLRAAFQEIADARAKLRSDVRVLQLLNARRQPRPEGVLARPDRPVSFSTLLRKAYEVKPHDPIEWRYLSNTAHLEKIHRQALARFHPAPTERVASVPIAPSPATGGANEHDQTTGAHTRREPTTTTRRADTRAAAAAVEPSPTLPVSPPSTGGGWIDKARNAFDAVRGFWGRRPDPTPPTPPAPTTPGVRAGSQTQPAETPQTAPLTQRSAVVNKPGPAVAKAVLAPRAPAPTAPLPAAGAQSPRAQITALYTTRGRDRDHGR